MEATSKQEAPPKPIEVHLRDWLAGSPRQPSHSEYREGSFWISGSNQSPRLNTFPPSGGRSNVPLPHPPTPQHTVQLLGATTRARAGDFSMRNMAQRRKMLQKLPLPRGPISQNFLCAWKKWVQQPSEACLFCIFGVRTLVRVMAFPCHGNMPLATPPFPNSTVEFF